jgi:signal transduction histidine kinase
MTEMVSVPLVAIVPAGTALVAVMLGSLAGDRFSPSPSSNVRPVRTLLELGNAANVGLSALAVAWPLRWGLEHWRSPGGVLLLVSLAIAAIAFVNASWVGILALASGRPLSLASKPAVVLQVYPVQALVAALLLVVYFAGDASSLLLPTALACLFCEGTHRLASTAAVLAERNAERDRLLKTVLESGDAQRLAIASEVHDGPLQAVLAAGLRVETAADRVSAGDNSGVEADLRDVVQDLRSAANSLRNTLRTRLIAPRADESLRGALLREVDAFRSYFPEGVTLDYTQDRVVPGDIEVLLFQVAHEALVNAQRHAGANRARITISGSQVHVRLTVDDDGLGFDTSASGGSEHLGLAIARERVALAGGEFEVRSSSQGTLVSAVLPLAAWRQP